MKDCSERKQVTVKFTGRAQGSRRPLCEFRHTIQLKQHEAQFKPYHFIDFLSSLNTCNFLRNHVQKVKRG